MKLYKCEATSCVANQKFEFKSSATTEWPHNWPDGEISYRLNNFSDDLIGKWQKRAVTEALMAWQLKIQKIKFRMERNMTSHVDFNVSFKPISEFSSPNILAQCYYPGQGEVSGDCEINDNWDWVASIIHADMGHPPLVPILIHEFGHGIGLVHATEYPQHVTDIMYPSFDLGKKKNDIGPYSTGRAQSRYGVRTVSQRFEDLILLRRNLGKNFR